jgi:hypothetical protein
VLAQRLLDVLDLVVVALAAPLVALGALTLDGLACTPQRLAGVRLAAASL